MRKVDRVSSNRASERYGNETSMIKKAEEHMLKWFEHAE